MTQGNVVRRRAARVVVVDPAGRVLLIQGCDPESPDVRFWFTPGGGLDAGESAAAAGARELYEETGLVVSPEDLGAPVREYSSVFEFDGATYHQEQEVFLLRTASFAALPTALEAHEVRSDLRLEWFAPEDLAALPDPVYPADLPDLVRQATSGG